MEELSELLMQLFSKDTRYHNYNEIKKELNLKGEIKEKILNAALTNLVENGKILFDKKYGYKDLSTDINYIAGTLEINKAGTGFVHANNGNIILIENADLNGALNGDNVIVNNIFSKRKDYFSGEIYKIIKRNTGNVIYEVVGNGETSTLIPYNINEYINVHIKQSDLKNLMDGDIVLVNVGCESYDGIFPATITKIIGNKDYPDIDIKIICEKYNVKVDFDGAILEEVKNIPKEVTDNELNDRVDLRKERNFTIDCDKTKDRDDNVGIKKLDNGNYLLKVNIAHVSHYIKPGMKSFEEALKRCSSHYPGNTCIPMLHPIISNGICSLNEGVDRLTRTVEVEINKSGEIVNYRIYKSVINSNKSMSYSNVNKVLNNESVIGYDDYVSDLKLMKELSDILNKVKNKRNYINFKTIDEDIIENNKKEITGFQKNDYGVAGEMIENFMLLANTIFYNHFSWFILGYRVHECPNEEKVQSVLSFLRHSGINIPKIKNVSVQALKSIIDDLDDSELSYVIREWILKSMKKARYDTENIGHFALQYDTYGHFTSPIRRIIDLISHMTADIVDTFDYSEDSLKKFENFIKKTCNDANRIEKIDKIIEEETKEMLMAKYMEDKIGEEYEAIVIDLNKYSMIIRTKDLIKGKVKLENIKGDKYYYDHNKNAIIGRSTNKKYQVGNKVFVLVKDASKATRTVNFEIPANKILKKIP